MSITNSVKRLGVFGTVIAMIEGMNHFFDYILSPVLILLLGKLKGGAIFFVLAFLTNYLVIVWYKRTTTDWFGLEWLRLQEATGSKGLGGRIIKRVLRLARPLAYIGLCIYDPIYGFIYMRGRQSGSRFNSLDWAWFVLSNLIGILIWIGLVSSGVELIKSQFGHIRALFG